MKNKFLILPLVFFLGFMTHHVFDTHISIESSYEKIDTNDNSNTEDSSCENDNEQSDEKK